MNTGAKKSRSKVSFLHGVRKYRGGVKQYLLLLFLPLFLGVVLLLSTYSVISDQIDAHGELLVRQFQLQASSMLNEAQLVTETLLQDSKFKESISGEDASVFNPSDVVSNIQHYIGGSEFIGHVYVIVPQQNRIYTESGYYLYGSLDELLNKSGLTVQDIYGTQPESWSILNDNYTPPFFTVDIRSEDGSTSIGTMVITLQMAQFLRIMYATDAELCCLFNDFCSISTIPVAFTEPDWYSDAGVSDLLGLPVKCVYYEQQDFTYLVAVSVKEYYAPVRLIVIGFALYFAVVLVAEFIYLVSISKRRYNQIAAMIEGLPHTLTSGDSDEELFIKIKKSLEDYQEKNKSDHERHRADTMRHVLLDHYEDAVLPQRVTEAGIPVICDGYYVVTFFVGNFTSPEEVDTQTNQDVIDLIFHTTLTKMAAGKAVVASVDIYPNYTAVICPKAGEDIRETVVSLVCDVVGLLEKNYGMTINTTISSYITNPGELAKAYQETLALHSFARSIDSDAELLLQEDVRSGAGLLLNGDYIKQLQILTNTLLVGKYDMVPTMVESILKYHVAPLRRNYEVAQLRLQGVAHLLAEAVYAGSPDGMDKEKAAFALRKSESVSALITVTEMVFANLSENRNEEDPVCRACAFIRDHVSDPNLNVPMICEAMDISVQHLSRLFRQKRDATIMEYVNSCRISMAKELLLDSRLTVAKISEQVGYSSTETFTRNFRRIEGVTPTDYRNLNRTN